MNPFFGADFHFQHPKILIFEPERKKLFPDLPSMNTGLIKRHNERVKPGDEYYSLGDLIFGGNPHEFLDQMNGNFHFVCGNHDRNNGLKTRIEQMTLRIGGIKTQLVHNPEYASVDYQLILCGHVHSRFKVKELRYCGKTSLILNVGVDVWNYRPVKWDEIQGIYQRWDSEKKKLKKFEEPKIIKELNKWSCNG